MNVASSTMHSCADGIRPFCLDAYDMPTHDTWYGVKRPFLNKPIFLLDPWKSLDGHVIEGMGYEDSPSNVKIEYNLL